jgi:hypothetical protein
MVKKTQTMHTATECAGIAILKMVAQVRNGICQRGCHSPPAILKNTIISVHKISVTSAYEYQRELLTTNRRP